MKQYRGDNFKIIFMEDFPVSCFKYRAPTITQQAEIKKKSGCEKMVHFVFHSRMK